MGKLIRVVHVGLGAIGRAAVRQLLTKSRFKLVGAVDVNPAVVGKDAGDVIGFSRRLGVKVGSDIRAVLRKTRPDIVLHTTGSSLAAVADEFRTILSEGVDCASTTEELFFPWRKQPALARKLDAFAKRHRATLHGTGVNPGFAMDALVLIASHAALSIERVRVLRALDASTRRENFQKKIGAGLAPAESRRLIREGKLGHVGLRESLDCVADGLGMKLDRVTETRAPIVAKKNYKTEFLAVKKGDSAGIRNRAQGFRGGKCVLDFDLRMAVGLDGSTDEIYIDGTNPVHLISEGGFHGDRTTVAALVNSIPRVIAAMPGLMTVVDLALPRGIKN